MTRARFFVTLATLMVALTLAVFWPRAASAHDPGLSRGEYSAEGAVIRAVLVLATRDVVVATRGDTTRVLSRAVSVSGDGRPCPAKLVEALPFETDGTKVVIAAACPTAPQRVEIEVALLGLLPFGHRHLVHVVGEGAPPDATLTVAQRTFAFTPTVSRVAPLPPPSLRAFVAMGIEHIARGADHLAFLLGLLLLGGRWRALVAVITAFTAGHSISLALATFGVIAGGARWVEPAIALSVAFVGLEDFVLLRRGAPAPRRRIALAAVFGLVHGLGFSSALREIGLPRGELPRALLGFNVGVELGQLGALVVVVPLLARARRWQGFDRAAQGTAIALTLAGAAWFVARL